MRLSQPAEHDLAAGRNAAGEGSAEEEIGYASDCEIEVAILPRDGIAILASLASQVRPRAP